MQQKPDYIGSPAFFSIDEEVVSPTFTGTAVQQVPRLRIRNDFGVTSTSSSSAMNSMHCSSVSCLYGTRRTASSEPEARMFKEKLLLANAVDIEIVVAANARL